MRNRASLNSVVSSTLCMVMTGAACTVTPVVNPSVNPSVKPSVNPSVKPSCAIAWDKSEDYSQVTEYRLTVWRVNEQQALDKTTHVVKVPNTQVPCQDVGANKSGRWQVTVQACLEDGTCSDASEPISFQVAEK